MILKNQQLFELSKEGKIFPSVYHFLNGKNFPWENLGPHLTVFLQSLISTTDPEQRLPKNLPSGIYLENKESIVIEPGAHIEPLCLISGPTYIAAGATVRHGAYIRGSVMVCPGAIVGHTTETKGSLFLNGAKAGHFAYVGDSILGLDCNLGAGTKLANLRLDGRNVRIDGYETGLKKLGAILGNRAQTGCNAVTNPGTVLHPDARLYPLRLGTGILGKPLST